MKTLRLGIQAEYTRVASGVPGSFEIGAPGEAGYKSSDPKDYQDVIVGPEPSGWRKTLMVGSNSIIDHDAVEWLDVP